LFTVIFGVQDLAPSPHPTIGISPLEGYVGLQGFSSRQRLGPIERWTQVPLLEGQMMWEFHIGVLLSRPLRNRCRNSWRGGLGFRPVDPKWFLGTDVQARPLIGGVGAVSWSSLLSSIFSTTRRISAWAESPQENIYI
ncbi:hypothetical protein Taro_009528, partial [Colocasia esculenta]|nr:hypothetical protein [Colocasia esculenta]